MDFEEGKFYCPCPCGDKFQITFLSRFNSIGDVEKLASLNKYIFRMKLDQGTSFYLPNNSKAAILKPPTFKKYQKSCYEVLLLGFTIDEFCAQHLREYEEYNYTINPIANYDINFVNGSVKTSKMFIPSKHLI